ncbi:arginine/serine-rich coiled-coil protein 2 isoform X1 [Epinephelus fuscoguttatus]|uniref:arginine/serine-rich coiled-coil protein 2 isoform X1 n=1 Tax=Epinephelus fuscoguttatus TaxID=293821 RepID=UPI0020D0DA80|nr:arginine/serine-rich coiled-coil protein 2 isoform X1 [Epinephelus fuscoguttatus]XP_049907261.1 arginine/serine-rich coiled-coil protein 2 isoform X1 [Epinephelus moara]
MSGSDNDSVDLTRTSSPVHHRKKHSMESSRSPRSSKHHHSRSRSRSRDRKRDRKYRRSRSRSKEARKRDSEKPSKSHRKTDEQQEHERLSAENGEERSRRKDRRPSKGRSLSRSHSRERRHHSKSKDKRRSRSRSRDRKKKARSRSGSRTKHRHHSRSRSKSRERKKRSEKARRKSRSRSVNPPAFRGRNTAMDAQEALARRLERAKKLQEQKEKEMLDKQQQQQQEIAAVAAPIAAVAAAAAAATSNPALNVAALLASGTQVTPQIAMAAQMAALQAKTLAETGIAVPSYYNPSAVNPMKFAEQEKKRKMLWQGKKEGDKSQTAELWEKLNFGNKNQNVKFRKLMGIKGEDEAEAAKPLNDEGLKTLQKQEEMFRNLDVQYEMARSQTHTQRGMGLGFTSSFSRGMDSI